MGRLKKQESRDGARDEVEFVGEDGAATSANKVKKIREKLKACEKERQEYLDGWQRSKADSINARKQEDVHRLEACARTRQELIEQFLPVLDSFELAFKDKGAWGKVDKNWRAGVEYIYSQLTKVLEENGVVPIDPKGELFDPQKHESVAAIETNEADDSVVLEVVQKGYALNNIVVRPARVKVAAN